MNGTDPHADQPVFAAGEPLATAKAVTILLHGRGANAADILGLAQVIRVPGIAWLAPDAAGNAWYRNQFMNAAVRDEPAYASAHKLVARLIARAGESNISPDRVALLGFSQGGCLALDFAARNARRYGAVVGLSAGLIGERIDPAGYSGSLDGTPVFLGCSDVDPFIPLARVRESAEVMRRLGGAVDERIYPGAPHTIVPDEVEQVRQILARIAANA
jgi:predicted esterase